MAGMVNNKVTKRAFQPPLDLNYSQVKTKILFCILSVATFVISSEFDGLFDFISSAKMALLNVSMGHHNIDPGLI